MPGAGLLSLLLHVRTEEILYVDLQVVFGVLGEVEGGIQHAPDGDDADEVADQNAAEDGLGDIAAKLSFAFALMDGEDLLEGEIKAVEGFCVLLGARMLVFHALTEPLTDETDAAPHAVLVNLAKIEAAALDRIAFMGDGALDGCHGCLAGELADNVFLAFEVVIEGAFGNAGVLRDVFHRYVIEAMRADQALGRIQKLCFCPFRFLCECHESSCKERLVLCSNQHFPNLFYILRIVYRKSKGFAMTSGQKGQCLAFRCSCSFGSCRI